MHKCIIAKCIHYVLIDCWDKISVVAQVNFDPEKVVEMHVNFKIGNEGWLRRRRPVLSVLLTVNSYYMRAYISLYTVQYMYCILWYLCPNWNKAGFLCPNLHLLVIGEICIFDIIDLGKFGEDLSQIEILRNRIG